MKFYYPELLFGLFLIAIPVIIHLFNFRKFKKVHFSNTRFLKEIKIQTSSREKIKERLILLSRILAVMFLVMAFAKPYFPDRNNSSVTSGNNIISIYIDNSYSMDAVGKNGTLLEEARKKAIETVQAFGLNDKFQLLTNELSGIQNKLLNRDEMLTLLDSVSITPHPNHYQKILNSQRVFFQQYPDFRKYAFLISDFQKNKQNNAPLKTDSTVNYRLITVHPNKLPNIAIDSVWFLSPIHQPQAEEKLVVQLQNYSEENVENVPIALNINGTLKTIGNVTVEAREITTDTLFFSGLNAGWQKAEVSIKDYPVVFDDRYYFTFYVKPSLPVTIISREKRENYFSAVFATDSFFDVENISESELNYTTFTQRQLIVLNNLKNIPEGLSQQLKQYVQNGGNIAVFIPLDADLSSYQRFLQSTGTDYPLTLKQDTVRADRFNATHPVFNDLFEKRPENIDLPRATSYFALSRNTQTTATVLMSEGNLSLLSVYQSGKGNLYLSAYPLEKNASNFATHGLFLPIMFKMAMLKNIQNTLAYTVGYHDGILLNTLNISQSEILNLKGENITIIPEVKNTSSGSVLFFADQIKSAGFYELYQKKNLLEIIAFNDSRDESVRDFYAANELKNNFGITAAGIINQQEASVTNQIKEINSGTSLWKLCLILTLLFLATEILLVRFFRTGKAKIKDSQFTTGN